MSAPADSHPVVERAAPVSLVGADTMVPCLDGRPRRYVNLDNAASTPVMGAVWDAVEAFVPWYSSVHRGSGLKSQVSTAAYEDARNTVAGFVGARADDAVVFVRNTTEAINVLSAALPAGARVLSSAVEHHSNLLPWRRHDLRLLPFTGSPDELLDACERALRSARPRIDLIAVTGASNVTGEVWPVSELAESRMPTGPSCSSTLRSSRRTVGSTWPVRGSTSWRSRATSSTRRSEPGRWWATIAGYASETRCYTAAGRSSS